MMNSKSYAENHGKNIINIFVLIGLKRGKKEDIVNLMKTKTRI